MPVYDLFSKRLRRAQGGAPEIYTYDVVPQALRVQIVHIVRDALGKDTAYNSTESKDAYTFLHDALAREYGVFRLTAGSSAGERFINFLLESSDTLQVLDAVELAFRMIETLANHQGFQLRANPKLQAGPAVSELNHRFKEHAVGYEYANGFLIRVDSAFIHAEVVVPVLKLLQTPGFTGANEEFLKAHEHYRTGNEEEAINECLKALESSLKAICDQRQWEYAPTDTAKKLLDIVFARGLVPPYLQSEFAGLRSILEGGVPTIRNKTAGHGQGSAVRVVPEHLTSYVLHLTAASILFLGEAHSAMK